VNTHVKALQLKARHQVYTLLSGHNLSKLHGEGYDFAELREYQIGDDIRKINWTITAKLGKPYIKELHANRELSIVVATFMDGSMYFGQNNKKQEKLAEVATILGYAAYQNADLFTGISYLEESVKSSVPSKQIYEIEHFSTQLFQCNVLNTSLRYKEAVRDLFKRLHKPSLLFVLSDFLEELDLSLLAQKHEVIAIIIRDRAEEFPEKLGEVNLTDPKTGAKLDTYFANKSIQEYQKKLFAHDQKQQEHFSRYDIRSLTIFTDEEVIGKLIPLFT